MSEQNQPENEMNSLVRLMLHALPQIIMAIIAAFGVYVGIRADLTTLNYRMGSMDHTIEQVLTPRIERNSQMREDMATSILPRLAAMQENLSALKESVAQLRVDVHDIKNDVHPRPYREKDERAAASRCPRRQPEIPAGRRDALQTGCANHAG